MEQVLIVRAPLDRVATLLERFTDYPKLFPDLVSVTVARRDGSLTYTDWEQKVPLFFIPNVKYQMAYLIDSSISGRKIYRYQLQKKRAVKIERRDHRYRCEAGRIDSLY